MAKRKDEVALLLEAMKSKNDKKFWTSYEVFRKQALVNIRLYDDLYSETSDYKVSESWMKAFFTSTPLIKACQTMKYKYDESESDKQARKSSVVNCITNGLKQNVQIGELKEIANVYADIISAYTSRDEKCRYLAMLWEILNRLNQIPEGEEFYGETAERELIKRCKENLSYLGIDDIYLKNMLDVEEKEYVKAFIQNVLNFGKSVSKTPKAQKENRTPIGNIIAILTIIVVLLILGFLFRDLLSKSHVNEAYNTLKIELDNLRDDYEETKKKYDALLEENLQLEKKIKELKELQEQNSNQDKEQTIELEEMCQLRSDSRKSSELLLNLQAGYKVTVLEELDNGWLKVRFQDEIGYIEYSIEE